LRHPAVLALPTLKQLLAAGHTIELVVGPSRIGCADGIRIPHRRPSKSWHRKPACLSCSRKRSKTIPDFRARAWNRSRPGRHHPWSPTGAIIPEWMLNLPRPGQHKPACIAAAEVPWRRSYPVGSGQWGDGHRRQPPCASTRGSTPATCCCSDPLSIQPDQTAEQLFPFACGKWCRSSCAKTLEGLESGLRSNPFRRTMPQHPWPRSCSGEDALVDFTRSAADIYNRWRGFQPWPGAYTLCSRAKAEPCIA